MLGLQAVEEELHRAATEPSDGVGVTSMLKTREEACTSEYKRRVRTLCANLRGNASLRQRPLLDNNSMMLLRGWVGAWGSGCCEVRSPKLLCSVC